MYVNLFNIGFFVITCNFVIHHSRITRVLGQKNVFFILWVLFNIRMSVD